MAWGAVPLVSARMAATVREKSSGIVSTAAYRPSRSPASASAASVATQSKPPSVPSVSAVERSAPAASGAGVPSAPGTVAPSSRSTTAARSDPRLPVDAPSDQVRRPPTIERDGKDEGQADREPPAGPAARRCAGRAGAVGHERLAGGGPARPPPAAVPAPTAARAATPAPTATGRGAPAPANRKPDGHQAQSPAMVVIAGTRIERTRKVSISTPIATATPTWNRIISGAVAIEPNVPARIRPAEVITAPVCPEAIRTASFIGRVSASSRIRCIRKML